MGYGFRGLVTDWHGNWSRLSLYHYWRGPHGEKLVSTNNVTEQLIGQCVKERYRTMRGYQRGASILSVSWVIAWLRMPASAGDPTSLIAR